MAGFGLPGSRHRVCGNRGAAALGLGALAALCSELRCPGRIAEACLRALPPADASPQKLTQLILAGLPFAADASPLSVVREQSRVEFRDNKIIAVEGWILSVTETRVYALTALLSETKRHNG